MGAFDAIPDGLFAAGPFAKSFHTFRDVFEFAGNIRVIMNGGIDVE